VIGTYAQSDYCAANAYQDAFAHQKRVQDHFPIWSINWGIWQDTGAAMRLMMSKTAAASHPQWVAHPLFDYRIVSESRIVYAGRLSLEQDWILKEHRLNHQAIVPGTAYLELARAAFQHHTNSPTFELQSVYFLKPLVVPTGQEVEFLTLLEPITAGKGFEFTILSGPLTEHAKGIILPGTQVTSQQYDIALLKRYCPQPQPIISANQSADQLTTVGPVAIGPRWSQALQTVQFGIQQGLALISLPTTYLDDLLHYHLHPALLDIATSFALGNGDFYLPLAYQKLRYYQPLPAKFYAYARYLEDSTSSQETLSYEVLLLDETGQECVAIEGFTLRKVDTENLVLEENLPETDLTWNNWLAPNIHPELQEGMSSAEGAEAFTRVLAQDAPQVVVSTQELTAVLTRNETQHILRNKTEHLQQFQAVEQQIQRHQAQSPSPLKLATAITFEVSTASVQEWEQALIPIWQEVLGVQQITATDNFFELNGDSLLAIMVTTRIRTAFQIEATPDLLFKAPTIALLALALVHQNKGTSSNQTIFEPMTSNLVGKKEKERTELARTSQILPLTFGQQRMWFLSSQVPQDDVYIIPSVYKIQGALNVSAFKASLAALIRRHDALRTTFTLEQGQVKQVIWTTQPLVLTESNLLNLPVAEQASEVNRLLTHFLQQPFHLLEELPWRLLLIQVAPEEYIFGMIFHNIIVDGWSLGVLNRDLATLYNAFCHHHASPLAALTMNYADFTRWQGEHFQGETLAATVSYWEQRLTSLPTTVLPYDHSPTTTPNGYRGKVLSLRIPANLVSQLKTFNAQHQATMFITLCATFELLLHSYQPQEIITVWSPFANRTQQALEPVAGLFVNALPVSLDCRGNPSFLQLVQRFQTAVLELTQHSHFPFAQLLEKHDFSRQPLTRTEFVFHNYSLSPVQLDHLTVTPLGMEIGSTAYDLEVHLWQVDRGGFSDSIEAAGSIAGELFYNTAFFEPETINGLVQRFQQLLERVLSQPERAIKEILASLPRIKAIRAFSSNHRNEVS
jgi:acyl carrier protein